MHNHEDFYSNHYSNSQSRGIQGWGNSLSATSLLRYLGNFEKDSMLELGAGSGEFTQRVLKRYSFKKYIASDLIPGAANPHLFAHLKGGAGPSQSAGEFEFQVQDAEKLSFSDELFSLVFSTCLLAHVNDPEQVVRESLRVTRSGGTVLFLAPTDPGMLNQLVKMLVTYPAMARQGIDSPGYVYAKEHRNAIHNLLAIAKVVGRQGGVKIRFRPFFLPTWQFNLWVLIELRKP